MSVIHALQARKGLDQGQLDKKVVQSVMRVTPVVASFSAVRVVLRLFKLSNSVGKVERSLMKKCALSNVFLLRLLHSPRV